MEDRVNELQSITFCTRDDALAFLERYSTVEAATNAFFDNNGMLPAQTQNAALGWDEAQFHTDKTEAYGPENRPGTSFHIESADSLNPGVFGNQAAPTRPSSRVSNIPSNTPNDPMAMSHHSVGQEMGVTSATGGGHFGPARDGEYYDTANWTMVAQPAAGAYGNPDPEDRQRTPGVPAFMRSVSQGHYLQSLMTILHAIPMAKEALLARDFVLNDYGQSTDWWDGSMIRLAKIVLTDQPYEDTEWQDIIHEAQREIAFLEQTDRAYGNVNPLVQQEGVFNGTTTEQGDFLKMWAAAVARALPKYDLADVFKTVAYNDPLASDPDDQEQTSIYEVAVHVNPANNIEGPSLYEHLDDMLWSSDAVDDEPKSIHMAPGDILVFEVSSTGAEPGLGIDIPGTLYSDRYLKENMEITKRMRKRRMEVMRSIESIYEKQKKLKQVVNPKNGKFIDAGELLDYATLHFEAIQDKSGVVKPQEENVLVDVGEETKFEYSDVAAELKKVADRVGKLITSLDEAKAKAEKQLYELSDLFKQPSEDPELNPTHRYTLRGVSTDLDTTYVLANPNSADDLLETSSDDWIWWKLTYNSSSTPVVGHEQVTLSDVLLAAKHDSRKTLLVYASDGAVSFPTSPLPPQLRNFVRADNLNFERELQDQVPKIQGERMALSDAGSNNADMDDQDYYDRQDFGAEGDYDEGIGEMDGDPPPYDAATAGAGPQVVDKNEARNRQAWEDAGVQRV